MDSAPPVTARSPMSRPDTASVKVSVTGTGLTLVMRFTWSARGVMSASAALKLTTPAPAVQ